MGLRTRRNKIQNCTGPHGARFVIYCQVAAFWSAKLIARFSTAAMDVAPLAGVVLMFWCVGAWGVLFFFSVSLLLLLIIIIVTDCMRAHVCVCVVHSPTI